MTPRTTKVLMIVAVLVVCLALGFKWLRYTAPTERMDTTFETRLTKYLSDQGWQAQHDDAQPKNSAVEIIAFDKPGCESPLRVSIVGTTSGLESYLRQTFGEDLAFVQHGAVFERPSLLRFQIVKTWNNLVAAISGRPSEQRPILAVIPAPKRLSTACDGPSQAQWEAF